MKKLNRHIWNILGSNLRFRTAILIGIAVSLDNNLCLPQTQTNQEKRQAESKRLADFLGDENGLLTSVKSDDFLLDPFLRERNNGSGSSRFRNSSNLYRLFFDEDLCLELGLNEELTKELNQRAKSINTGIRTGIRGGARTGDFSKIENVEALSADFEEHLLAQLTDAQKADLRAILFRQTLWADGLIIWLRKNQQTVGLTESQIAEIVTELHKKSTTIKLDGARKFIDGINRILPGYLEPFSEDELAKLPLLPLGVFLAISEPGKYQKLLDWTADKSVNLFDVDLQRGDWIFPGLKFRRNVVGKPIINPLSNTAYVPSFSFLVIQLQAQVELNDDQRASCEKIISDHRNKKKQLNSPEEKDQVQK